MTPTEKKVIATAVAAAALGAIALGVLTAQDTPAGNRSTVPFDPPPPPGAQVECLKCVAHGVPAALPLVKLRQPRPSHGRYAEVRTCWVASETATGAETLPAGIEAIADSCVEVPYPGDGNRLVIIADGESELPCRCSTGTDCERLLGDGTWAPAPRAPDAMVAGTYRGAGCYPRVCEVFSGRDGDGDPPECLP
jgi:hypothetical protein